jgi:hypothetical protein
VPTGIDRYAPAGVKANEPMESSGASRRILSARCQVSSTASLGIGSPFARDPCFQKLAKRISNLRPFRRFAARLLQRLGPPGKSSASSADHIQKQKLTPFLTFSSQSGPRTSRAATACCAPGSPSWNITTARPWSCEPETMVGPGWYVVVA